MELEKKHWEQAKTDNTNLILMSKLNIQMAERILVMVDEELAKFPEDKPIPPAEPIKA